MDADPLFIVFVGAWIKPDCYKQLDEDDMLMFLEISRMTGIDVSSLKRIVGKFIYTYENTLYERMRKK